MGADDVCEVVMVGGDGAEVVVGHVAGRPVDLATVDVLARLQLAARRRGGAIRLRPPCTEVRELLDLVGLAELADGPLGLPLEAGGETEGGE